MKKVILALMILASGANAKYFYCNDYKRNLYVEVSQPSTSKYMYLYNRNGKLIDTLYPGRAKAGNYRYYGDRTTVYVYKNKRQFSIRTYDPGRNRTGNIFGVFNCRSRY